MFISRLLVYSIVFITLLVSSTLCLARELNKKNISKQQNYNVTSTISYDDLVKLSQDISYADSIQPQLNQVLNNPIVDNSINNKPVTLKECKKLGKYIRVASWNIERGLKVNSIINIFNKPEKLLDDLEQTNPKAVKKVEKQMEKLNEADIIILTEVDIGMPRTKYKNIARTLAKNLNFNYAYAVEFLEIDPAHLGLEDFKWSEEKFLFPDQDVNINKEKYKGLHGTAILSKFPLKNVRVVRLPKYYDWYNGEKLRISRLEKLKRASSVKIFGEAVIREIRYGSRVALIADVDIPESDTPITLVATHLENRTIPKNRKKQLKMILSELYNVNNPIIIGGDFNTDITDASPSGATKKLKSRKSKLLSHFNLYNISHQYAITPAMGIPNALRKHNDPTVKSIPLLLTNPERGLFKTLKKFKFNDGNRFDFRSTEGKYTGKKGTLANSNERCFKGFVPTYMFQRPLYLGKYKLDWLFVKDYCKKPEDNDSSYKLAPHFGTTLFDLNFSFKENISDHAPIIVDLPINEPAPVFSKKELKKLKKKQKKKKHK